MANKKILYVVTKSNWGGAQRYVYDLATAMAREGHEVSVAAGGDGTLMERLKTAGVTTISLPSLSRDIAPVREIQAAKELWNVIKEARPDILHLNSPKAGFIGAVLGRLLRVPRIVYTSHGWPFNEERIFAATMLFWFLSWLTVLLSHMTVTVSEKDEESMRTLPFTEGRIATIHNGIEAPAFLSATRARAALKENLATDKGTLWLGMVSELIRNKGVRYAIEAFQEILNAFPNAVLVIIGEGEERAALERQIARAQLKGHVRLTGFVENASTFLSAFDIFLLSSVKEGLPYALIEAGHAALPVVTTSVGGIPEIVAHMRSGLLVDPKNPRALAEATITLLKKIIDGEELGRNLRTWVRDEFAVTKMVERTRALAYRL